MNDEAIYSAISALQKIVNEQRVQIFALTEAVTAVRGCLEADKAAQVDAAIQATAGHFAQVLQKPHGPHGQLKQALQELRPPKTPPHPRKRRA